MHSIAIFPVSQNGGSPTYRAVSKNGQAEGRTAGEALDAAIADLPKDDPGALVLLQPFLSDALFTQAEQARLEELMARWRKARDAASTLPEAEQAELELLVETELQAAAKRAGLALQGFGG